MKNQFTVTLSPEWMKYANETSLDLFGQDNMSFFFTYLLNKLKKEQMDNFGNEPEVMPTPVYRSGMVSISQELNNRSTPDKFELSSDPVVAAKQKTLLEKYGTPQKPTVDALAAQDVNSTRANRNNNFKSVRESEKVDFRFDALDPNDVDLSEMEAMLNNKQAKEIPELSDSEKINILENFLNNITTNLQDSEM